MAQGTSGVFVQFNVNDGFGGALIKPTSSGHIIVSTMLSNMSPLLNHTPIYPTIVNEALPSFLQGVMNDAEKDNKK